jgi:hypothetical protein
MMLFTLQGLRNMDLYVGRRWTMNGDFVLHIKGYCDMGASACSKVGMDRLKVELYQTFNHGDSVRVNEKCRMITSRLPLHLALISEVTPSMNLPPLRYENLSYMRNPPGSHLNFNVFSPSES